MLFLPGIPEVGKRKRLIHADVEKFLELARENEFGKLVAHAPYTMNCCAAKENLRDFAREIMSDDLKRMEYTPGNCYNFHPGSHVGQGAETGIKKICGDPERSSDRENRAQRYCWKPCQERALR